MPLTTDTGKEFEDATECLHFIRGCQFTMLDPGASLMDSHRATVEMVYAFKALDTFLRRGGVLPFVWEHAAPRNKGD